LFLALYLVLVMVPLIFELRALVFVLPPQVAIMGPFMKQFAAKVHLQDWSAYIFYLGLTSMSVIAHMDLASNALFLSKVLATGNCHADDEGAGSDLDNIEEFWQSVWERAFLYEYVRIPQFAHCLIFVWFALFGQIIYALMASVPVSVEGKKARLAVVKSLLWLDSDLKIYDIRDRDLGGKDYGFYTYSTMLHGRTQHNVSLMALADAARMYTLRFNGWFYKQKLVRQKLYKSGQLYNEVWGTLLYFLFFLMFENIIQLELQSTALEIGIAMNPHHRVDWEIALSLALSFTMAVYNVYSTSRRMWSQVWACWTAETTDSNEKCQRHNERVQRYGLPIVAVAFVALVFLYLILLVHAFMKTLMVSSRCSCGWNFHIDLRCVAMEDGHCPAGH
jgi:hypothetical protein